MKYVLDFSAKKAYNIEKYKKNKIDRGIHMKQHHNVLILSVTAGNGHNSAAAALKEQFDRMGIACHIMDLFQYLSPIAAKLISDGYDQLTKRFRLVWKIGYGVALHDTTFKIPPRLIASPSNLQSMEQYLQDQDITHVVFTHPFAGVLLQTLKHYQAIALPTFGILTDFTIHPYWCDCTANDYFILPHAGLISAAEKIGFRTKQLKDFGIPVSTAFAEHPEKVTVRKRLNMPTHLPTILVMGGGVGYGNLVKTVQEIDQYAQSPVQIIVVCGRNVESRKELLQLQASGSFSHVVHIYGFTHQVPLLMAASDCIITKPGGITMSEALAASLPIIVSKPIPGQEEKNVNFLMQYDVICVPEKYRFSGACAANLVFDTARLQQLVQHASQIAKPYAARDICEFVQQCE